MTTHSGSIANSVNLESNPRKTGGIGRWLIILLVLLIAGAISAFYAINDYSGGTATVIKQSKANSDRFESIYKDAAERRLSKLRFGADLIVENKEIVTAFAQNDREALMAKALPIYNDILKKKHDVDRFTFWNPPAMLFLRANDPKAFGVDSSATRKIVVMANEGHAEISGMEPGNKGIIALRAVVPVMDGVRLVGAIEIGSELDSLLKRASKTSGLEYAVGLDHKLSEALQRPVDEKNDSKQGTDIYYIFSNPEAGKLLRSLTFSPRNIEPQVLEANGRTVLLRTFTLNDFAGTPNVVVTTLDDLTDEFAVVLQQTAIRTAILFVVIMFATLFALFKFRSLRDGLNRVLSRQRLELEERAAFCEAAAEKLKDVDILKRGFFTNLIASVNEPLLAVVGTLQSVTNSLDASRTLGVEVDKSTHNQLTERMNFALSETTRLSELIADYQQIELFRQQLVSSGSELISLSTVVARTISDDLLMIRRLPQLNFSFDVPDTLPQLRVDADLLRRAISALVKYAARGASQGGISLQASINTQGWMVLAITGTAFEKAGAPTESLLDESRQFLTRLATEHGRNDNSATLIPIVMARMIVEFYGGRIDASPDEKAYPGFVIYLPTAL